MADPDENGRTEERSQGGVKSWLRMLFGTRENSLKEALEEIIQEHEEDGNDPLSDEEKDMLRNVLEVGDLRVTDVMVPRADIVGVEYGAQLEQVTKEFIENGHTRVPVYEQSLDKLKGFLHLKDIVPALAGAESFDMDRMIRKLIFVSPTMKVVDLLRQMRVSGDHIAIVVDEYGGTDGLVTMEDLFEEIVGEIQDEHDQPDEEEELIRLSDRVYEAGGRTRVDAFEKEAGRTLRLPEEAEAFDTVGGFVFHRLGRVPVRGEIVMLEDGSRVDILDADTRSVRRLRLTLAETSESMVVSSEEAAMPGAAPISA